MVKPVSNPGGGGERGATLPKIQPVPSKIHPGGALPPVITPVPKPSGGGSGGSKK